jgi:hypothetical protein
MCRAAKSSIVSIVTGNRRDGLIAARTLQSNELRKVHVKASLMIAAYHDTELLAKLRPDQNV